MKTLLSVAAAMLVTVLPLSAFNVDPQSFNLSLKSGEKKQLTLRVANIYKFPVTASVSGAGKDSWIGKVKPVLLKLEAGAFTYVKAEVSAPENAAGIRDDSIQFAVTGAGKNNKFTRQITIPVRIKIISNVPKAGQPK